MATKREKAIASVKRRIKPVKEVDPYVRVLLYGRNKQGKTRIAATGPDCLVIDINERGTKSVRNYPGVEVFHVAKWEDVTWAYWMLKEGDHKYKTVVIDTVTAMQHMCMSHVLGEQEDRDPNREPSLPTRPTWYKMSELMKPVFLDFRNLPMHVVFVAQMRSYENEEEGTTERVPDLSPGIRGILTGAVDVIGYVYQAQVRVANKRKKKETKVWVPKMLVGPHDEYVTGGRLGPILPRVITNPTVPMLVEALNDLEEEEE